MRFDIVRNRMKDPQKFQIILKTFEYFSSINYAKEESLATSKDKEGILKLLFDLINYIEPGLKNKFSQNFNIMIAQSGTYAIKFDPKEFIGLKYSNYDILVYKTPYICVPSQFYKKTTDEKQRKEIEQAIVDLKKENFKRCFKLVNFTSKEDNITEDFISDTIVEAAAFQSIVYPTEDLTIFSQLIQTDLSSKTESYNWCVVFSKKILASQDFLTSSNVIYQVKFNDPEKKFHLSNRLNDNELFIFKKMAVFESVLKNIITGRLYDIEFKHLVVLASLVIFIFLVGMCKSDYSSPELKLTWFEENVCKNKRTIFGGIGLMFIFAIIFGFLKAKMNRRKNERVSPEKKKA
jgi:hypothetical protein